MPEPRDPRPPTPRESSRPDDRARQAAGARAGASWLEQARAWFPSNTDWWVVAPLLIGLAALYVPSYLELARSVWKTDEQGHGPIILGVSLWLFFQKREAMAQLEARPRRWGGSALLLVGLLAYVLGRSQSFLALEVVSQLAVIMAVILLFLGRAGLRLLWFPLFFMLFMTPFPEAMVAAVTGPLKSAVSTVSSELLYRAGYPISQQGVIITVGQYQLLVADACAGLNSMFTLEALGLLYLNLMNYRSVARNITLTVLVIPIAFVANIVRVMVLVLVTFHFGDEAGKGFVHDFAGILLFMVGLTLVLMTDFVLGRFFKEPSDAPHDPPSTGQAPLWQATA